MARALTKKVDMLYSKYRTFSHRRKPGNMPSLPPLLSHVKKCVVFMECQTQTTCTLYAPGPGEAARLAARLFVAGGAVGCCFSVGGRSARCPTPPGVVWFVGRVLHGVSWHATGDSAAITALLPSPSGQRICLRGGSRISEPPGAYSERQM